jgi:hypothetical protein
MTKADLEDRWLSLGTESKLGSASLAMPRAILISRRDR